MRHNRSPGITDLPEPDLVEKLICVQISYLLVITDLPEPDLVEKLKPDLLHKTDLRCCCTNLICT